MATPTEQDLRLHLLNSLMTCPHRRLEEVWPIHQDLIQRDPRFYVRLAAWHADKGTVRDHDQCFAAALSLSTFDGHRDVGLALLRELPPYQVRRVVDWIHGTRPGQRHYRCRKCGAETNRTPAKGLVCAIAGCNGKLERRGAAPKLSARTRSLGLGKNLPGSLLTEIRRYLAEREANPDWFCATVLQARDDMKQLHRLCHYPRTGLAHEVLFLNKPPAGSRLAVLKELAQAVTPAEQARLIIQHKLPYRVVTGALGSNSALTPAVLLALVEVMSPQELINNLGGLQRRGALDVPEVKAAVEAKLEKAKTSKKRVSGTKAQEAAQKAGVDAGLTAQLDQVADAQVKARGRLNRRVALLIDKSASMTAAIEVGRRLAALLSAACVVSPHVIAFDEIPDWVRPRGGEDLAAWTKAFAGINPSGATCPGAAVWLLQRESILVDQIILVTDEGENRHPIFAAALGVYQQQTTARPGVCIVRVAGGDLCTRVQDNLRAAGFQPDVWDFAGDYESLPQLITMLSRPSKLDLLTEIMTYPLPQRRPAPVPQTV